VRPATNQTRFTIAAAFGGWAVCFIIAQLGYGLIASLAGHPPGSEDPVPVGVTVLAVLPQWAALLGFSVYLSRAQGTGHYRDDLKMRFRLIDLIGAPIGVLSQLVLIPLVYWPLQSLFPSTFDPTKVEERARELWDSAQGVSLVALVLMVVIGAPLVEEIVYRGIIQQSLASRLDDVLALVLAAVFFAGIHFRAIEFPGLFAFALVLGVSFRLTGRLGMPIVAHIAFNAAGLAVAASA
jgi:membrane protease YdiL (CAAX protease family)